MTIDVQGPDGSIARFPDGTPDHVIASAMREQFGGPSTKPADNPDAAPPSNLAPGFLSDDPRDWATKQAAEKAQAWNPEAEKGGKPSLLNMIQGIAEAQSRAKQGPENVRPSDVLALGQVSPGMAGKPTGIAAKAGVARNIAEEQAFGPSVVEQFAAHTDKPSMLSGAGIGDNAAPPPAPPPAPVPVQGPPIPPQLSPRDQLAEAGGRQGVGVPNFIASESNVPKAIAGGLSGTPILQDPIVSATRGMAEGLGGRVEDLARGIVPHGGNNQSAGGAARDGMADWITNRSKTDVSAEYDTLDKLIKPDTKVPLSNLRRLAGEITASDIEAASHDGRAVIKATIAEALKRPEGLAYNGLKTLRTRIGDRLSGDIAETGVSHKLLDALYAAASDDLRFGVGQAARGVRGSGIAMAQAGFDRATTFARETAASRAHLADIIGTRGDARPAEVFDRIMGLASSGSRGDTQRLVLARDAMGPNAWDEVRAAALSRMGLDKDGNFSPTRFNTDYGPKRLAENARGILFGHELSAHLDDIAALSRAWEASAKYGNPSGSGRSVAVTAALAAVWMHPLALLGEVLTGAGLARALSRPATSDAVAGYMRAYTQAAAAPSAATEFLTKQAATNLMTAMGMKDASTLADQLKPQKKQDAKPPQRIRGGAH